VAKIADVGLAKVMTNADQESTDLAGGTFAYAAPELILGSRCTAKVRL
jgi:serine/threonine protein kinase